MLNSPYGNTQKLIIIISVQYEAARLVTGAIKGTNRLSMLQELSWDLLKTRRQIHKVDK